MAYDPGAIDTTLAAAVGDEPVLIAELRLAFVESAERALTAMTLAPDAEEWRAAAWRLKGLAASFGAVRLMTIATAVAEGDPRDTEGLKKLRRAIARL
ncbi:Hpt domain-containing protein [Sphingomonas sp. M1A8_2b]